MNKKGTQMNLELKMNKFKFVAGEYDSNANRQMNKFKFIAEEEIEKKEVIRAAAILRCRDCSHFRKGSRGDYCEEYNWVILDANKKFACNYEQV